MSASMGQPARITTEERSEPVRVRTTFTPGTVIEVDERELLDLDRQHLVSSREGDEGWEDGEPEPIESGDITVRPEAKETAEPVAEVLADPAPPVAPATPGKAATETGSKPIETDSKGASS